MKVAIINGFDVYEHRVELLYDYFKRCGCDVSVYTTDFLHREKIQRTGKKQGFNYVSARPYKKNLSFKRLYSHWNLAKDIFSKVDSDVDLLWIIVPPNSFAKRAAEFKRKNPNVKVILDVLDMWPETLPVGFIKNFFPLNLWRGLRNKHLHLADYIVTECQLFQKKLLSYVEQKKMTTIHLSYKDIELKDNNLNLLPKDRLSLCYLGSINNIIDITCIQHIISNLSKKQAVDLHIIGGGEKENDLVDVAKKAGATVIHHGKIYDDQEKQTIFQSCHFGLNIMKRSVFVGLTMKSVDYFKAGLPIINNIVGDTWDFVEHNHIGINTCNGEMDFHYSDYPPTIRGDVKVFYMNHFSEAVFTEKLSAILAEIIYN